MTKFTLATALLALAALNTQAQDDTMYLVKGDRVVGKYNVDAVDYLTFKLPENIIEESLWLTLGEVGKNNVNYTVNALESTTAYAHNILSYYDVNYTAMDLYTDMYENLEESEQISCLQYTLAQDAFVGIGTQNILQTDFQQYGSSEYERFSVMPGTKYFLCAWEIDPETMEPLETFIYQPFETLPAEEVNLELNVEFKRINSEGIALEFTGSDRILYVRTCWGYADILEEYEQVYGRSFLMGTFGQNWTLDYLSETGDLADDIENATWPADDPGEYVMYVDAYDEEGNVQHFKKIFTYENKETENYPEIKIFSKDKGDGYVKVNFEISPSNVQEAYVRMMDMNDVDDRLNMGYTLFELAKGGDTTDITSEINTAGEYTFESNDVEEKWMSIIIYAENKDGGMTAQRLDFMTLEGSKWDVANPEHGTRALKKEIRKIRSKRNPTLSRISR